MIWNRDKSACFEGYFLTHVSKYQLQIVYGREYQLLVRPPRAVKEITRLKVDNILNVTRSQMVDTSADSYPVSIIASPSVLNGQLEPVAGI